jgi:hypothetical protein
MQTFLLKSPPLVSYGIDNIVLTAGSGFNSAGCYALRFSHAIHGLAIAGRLRLVPPLSGGPAIVSRTLAVVAACHADGCHRQTLPAPAAAAVPTRCGEHRTAKSNRISQRQADERSDEKVRKCWSGGLP